MDELQALALELAETAHSKKHYIATAESCTGGLLAALLTEVPGASAWFDRGFVVYSNQAKIDMLGLKKSLIDNYGAVSEPVAEAMALSALQHSKASLTVAITGVAGPSGGSLEKPVGTVWFAYAVRGSGVQTERYLFQNQSRQGIRLLACRQALLGLIAYAT